MRLKPRVSADTKKARGRMVSDPALCTGTLLLGLAQQTQSHGDKRQDNADDGLAAQQAAGDNQALLLEGGVLGGLPSSERPAVASRCAAHLS